MKSILLLLLQCLFVFQSLGQSRYLEEVFQEVKISSDIVYGRNASVFSNSIFLGELKPIDLKMDVYEPIGDTLQERPLVLVFHDGNFLPPIINGSIIGSKKDSSVVEICTQLARRGFTAAALTYRQGWNPQAKSHVLLTLSLIQAIYRGVQDGRTAIRFFKRDYEENENEFHIDPNRITVWGNGTGGVVALNMVALSHINDIIFTSNGAGKFLYDSDGDGIPDTSMVPEEILGDIEGKNLTIAPYDYLYSEAGDTSNFENHSNYESNFHLSVNVGGSVADISWLHDNQSPTISIQSVLDQIYPYDEYYFVIHPGTFYFLTQGSKLIGELQDSLGNNQAWIDGINSDYPYTQQAILHSDIAEHPYYEGVYPYINELNSNYLNEGVVIDWWDPNGTSPIDGPGMGLPWNEVLYPGINEVSYHDYALLKNENMSAEKARANIDTIMNYFAPRACITLDLSDCVGDVFTNSTSKIANNTKIKLFPNPAFDQLTIDAGGEEILSIQIFDFNGQLLKTFLLSNTNVKEIDLGDIPDGFYVVKVHLKNEQVFQKFFKTR